MSNNVVICPNCQQQVNLEPGVAGGVCPFCNASLPVSKKISGRTLGVIIAIVVGVILFIGCLVLLLLPASKSKSKKSRERAEVASFVLSPLGKARESGRRASCVNNLKQIGNALEMYSQGSFSYLKPHGVVRGGGVVVPTLAGAEAAMEALRSQGHLTDHKVYVCPSSEANPGEEDDALSYRKKNLSYGYVYVAPNHGSSASAVSSDLADGWGGRSKNKANHEDYGNILYADGHVAGKIGSSDPDEEETWYSKENLGVRTSDGIGIPPNKVPTR